MKVYVGTSVFNKNNAKFVIKRLKEAGFEITYDWTFHGDLSDDMIKMKEVGPLEKKGVLDADFVVILLPGRLGTHVELGLALGSGKRIYLYAENEKHLTDGVDSVPFYHCPEIMHFAGKIENFVEHLIEIEKHNTSLKEQLPNGIYITSINTGYNHNDVIVEEQISITYNEKEK